MKCIYFITAWVFCISCNVSKNASFNPSEKYSKELLQHDFSVLTQVLHANHPSLYWYASKDSVEGYFQQTQQGLTDSLTEQQFRNRISWALNSIHCGHTTVRSSKKYAKYYAKRRLPQFPLSLKVWKDSAVVISNQLKDSILKRGTIITAINRYSIKEIIDSLCLFIGTDGYSNSFKYQLLSFNFPAFYRNVFGTDTIFHIHYVDQPTKQIKETTVTSFLVKSDSLLKKQPPTPGLGKKQLRKMKLQNERNLQFDSTLQTAFLSVNTFSEGKLIRFFRSSFKSIKKHREVKNLVVDLRLNSGGSVISSTRLLQYLVSTPFHVADTVAAFTRNLKYKKYIKPWLIYWLSMRISGKRQMDERIHFNYFEKHLFRQKKKYHFDGDLYLLTGGYTFSAATMVAEKLKGQQNVTVIGEETGGGAYGNSAMFLTTIVLPNTGIRVTLPLYRMVLNARLPKNGRGVMPDVEVSPTQPAILAGVDTKVEKVKEIIRERKKK